MASKPVVMLGDANVDLLIRLPERGPGKRDISGSVPQLFGGGTVANASVALARLGVPVAFVGMVGDDGYGRYVRDDLAREGIDTRGLILNPDVFTQMVLALVEPDGERMLVVWPPKGGAPVHLRPEDLDPDQIAGAAWLHTSGMVLREMPVREAVLHGMRIAREAGVPVSLDLNLRLELWGWGDDIRATLDRALPLVDVVFGSGAEEIVPVAGVEPVKRAAQTLADGQRTVVARLGAAGALAATPAEIVHAPAFPAEVVDTVGAGDAFDAGFIAARAAGHDLHTALRWGNAVAALHIGQPGARSAPTRAEVERLLGAIDER
jgi:sugar/nucleoside kinase (ribokinase family)